MYTGLGASRSRPRAFTTPTAPPPRPFPFSSYTPAPRPVAYASRPSIAPTFTSNIPYIGPPITYTGFGGLGDIAPVDITGPIDLNTGLFGPSVGPDNSGGFTPLVQPEALAPVDLSTVTNFVPSFQIQPSVPTPALAFAQPSAPANPAPGMPANQPSGSGGNWFSQDILPVLNIAAQAFEVSQTHQMPAQGGITAGPPVTSGLTAAQWGMLTPAQQAAVQMQAAQAAQAGMGAGSLTAMFESPTFLLITAGSVLAFILLMRKK